MTRSSGSAKKEEVAYTTSGLEVSPGMYDQLATNAGELHSVEAVKIRLFLIIKD
ncbi:MAG: hypothetical protein WBL21_09875 [Salinimicrobium sp.]